MTAVVGILNKSGIAIAADSAVTISTGFNEKKIYNKANKIFALSKFHPVSLMIYNSATFNGIPWEPLIKEYRKDLYKKSFPSLSEYRDDFIQFLRNKIHHIPIDFQDLQVNYIFEKIISHPFEKVVKNFQKDLQNINTIKDQKDFIKPKLDDIINNLILDYKSQDKILPDFINYEYPFFIDQFSEKLEKLIDSFYGKLDLVKDLDERLKFLCFLILTKNVDVGNWSGLVFSGFGENEIFPSCFAIKIGEIINERIRYNLDKKNEVEINQSMNSAIRPFAQRDVIDLILTGIDTSIEDSVYNIFREALNGIITTISNKAKTYDPKFASEINGFDINILVREVSEGIQTIKRQYHINPLMNTISTLSKEDLAELAESLIYLTYLKRRMSFSEESVGGPVDVALITKGDGFVWIKRKHYFDPKLNHNFLAKYLNQL